MAALLVRRASCFLFPLASRSRGSSSSSVFYIRSASSGPETSGKSPFFSFGTSDKLSLPNGVPFDSIEKDPEGRFVTLTRKTDDEIIELQVDVPKKDHIECVPNLPIKVKILYGDNFNRCFRANCEASPDNRFRIFAISIRPQGKSEHLEEFEDYFKERGVEPCYFNFILDHMTKTRIEVKQD